MVSFGAAVFGPDDRLIAVEVNRVLLSWCLVAHAEMMAYMLAQQRTQRAPHRDDDDRPVGPITLSHLGSAVLLRYGATICRHRPPAHRCARRGRDGADPVRRRSRCPPTGSASWSDAASRWSATCSEAACDVLRAYGTGGGARY